ncbi:MAG: GNAT family N-acetyltransferase [bacterium]|nr:GNAT family N-acetyltransferase [bacterium]
MKKNQYDITIDDINPEQIKPILHAGISDFNYQFFGSYELKKFAIYIKNETYDVIAGLYGFILQKHHCMRIEYFWVQKNHRNNGLGTRLIQQLEQYAHNNKCKCIQLSTMEFQGAYFYQKMGYRLIARVPKWFCDRDEFFFSKELPTTTIEIA